jgi:hypothetical protein
LGNVEPLGNCSLRFLTRLAQLAEADALQFGVGF